MKYLVVCLFLITSSFVLAQNEDTTGFVGFSRPSTTSSKDPTSVFKIGIIPFFFGQIWGTGELRFNYEKALAPHHSVLAGISYDFPNLLGLAVYSAGGSGGSGANGGHGGYGSSGGFLNSNYSFEGIRGMLGYRYYLLSSRNAPKGIYVGPYLSYNYVQIRDKAATENYEGLNYFDACAIFGFQAITSKHFAFDMSIGLGYKDNFVTHSNQDLDYIPLPRIDALRHVKGMLQLNFGYGL